MSFLGLQTPKNARDHPIIVWHPWRLFLAIFFATKMGSKFQKVIGNPNPQGSSKMSWVWAYLAGQHTASCPVSIVVLLNTIRVRHPSVTFVAVAFVDQSQMKRLYKYIHIRYKYIYFKWNPKNSHQPDIFSDSMFLSSVSPLSLHRRKTKKNMFSWMPCGYVQNQERKDKLAQTIATQSELREWRWKQARRAILMLAIAHVYSKYWWMHGFSLYWSTHISMTFGSFGDDSSRPLNCAKGLWFQSFFFGLYLDPWRKSSNLMSICLWGVEICHLGQRLCSWYVGTSKQRVTRQKLETETLKKQDKKERPGNIEVSVTRRLCHRVFPFVYTEHSTHIQPKFLVRIFWNYGPHIVKSSSCPHSFFPTRLTCCQLDYQAEGMKALAMQRAQEAKMVDLKAPKKILKFGKNVPNDLTVGTVVSLIV